MSGYIRLWRKITDSAVWSQDPMTLKVWLWLLMRVNWKSTKMLLQGHEVTIEPGEIVTSYRAIADAQKWREGERRPWKTPSVRNVRTYIEHLKALDCLSTVTRLASDCGGGSRQTFLHLKVLHWDEYQSAVATDSETDTRQSADRVPTAYEEVKKLRREEEDLLAAMTRIPGFVVVDEEKELAYLRTLVKDFPNLDIAEQIKGMAAWLLDNPPKATKPNHHSRLRKWCERAKPKEATITSLFDRETTADRKWREMKEAGLV